MLKLPAASKPDGQSGVKIYLRLLSYVWPYWPIFLVSIFGFLCYAATQPMFAGLMQYIVDAINRRDTDANYWIPAATVGIVLFRGIGSFLGNYYLAKVANSVVHTLRCQIFNRYTILPNAFFDDNNSGHLISRVTYNVTQVTSAATDAIKVVIREGLTVIGLLGYLLYMNWKLSLLFVAIAPIIGLVVRYAGKRFRKISKKIQGSMGDLTHVSSELINGYRVIRSFGGEEYEKKRFLEASRYNYSQSMKMIKTAAIHTPVLQLIVASALAVLIFMALMVMNDASAGEFVAYLTAATLVPKPVRQLSEVAATIQKGIMAAESIFEVLDEPQEVDTGTHTTPRLKGKLEFSDLSFCYPNSHKRILRNISFVVEPGETVALVGHSGSGKTTLTNLILRFYDHKEGRILLDDVDIQRYALKNLRQQMALVTQHVTLFNDTIERNIAYGTLTDTSREKVMQAAESANAMEFINRLPEGFDTLVGENGVKLSGGQRQRLSIARAILKDAPILILDEAMSALDTISEKKIQNALEHVMAGRTTLVIAHRLSTIENADKIVVMDDGAIVERGVHRGLIETKGVYAQLYNTQFKSEIVS